MGEGLNIDGLSEEEKIKLGEDMMTEREVGYEPRQRRCSKQHERS